MLLPLLQDFRNPSLRARHWSEIWSAVGTAFPTNDELTINKIVQLDLVRCKSPLKNPINSILVKKVISEISGSATQEAALEEQMSKIKTSWESREFTILPFKEGESAILGGSEELKLQLEDDQVTLATMSASRYAGVVQHVWSQNFHFLM